MYPGTHAASAPNRAAVIMAGSGDVVTYAQLDDNSARLAAALHGLGLRTGDVIALLSDNAPEAFEIYWAALRSGLYVTAVNWHLAPEEAGYILRDGFASLDPAPTRKDLAPARKAGDNQVSGRIQAGSQCQPTGTPAHHGRVTEATEAGHRAILADDRDSPSAEDVGAQFARADCIAMDKAVIALIVTFG